MIEKTIAQWHKLAMAADASGLADILADNVVFHSPVVHTPQEGKAITTMYLTAAFHTLNNEHFRYQREILQGSNAMLEFTTELDGIHINGVDIIHIDDQGRIDDFKVMVRPLKAINKLHEMMRAMLESMKK